MATKKRQPSKTKNTIQRDELEQLIYRNAGPKRFTQDSPVMPDVWFEFGKSPNGRVDLLMNPHFEASPGRVAKLLEDRLLIEQQSKTASKFGCDEKGGYDIAYNQSTVVVRLCFHELVRVVLPLTPWWTRYVWPDNGKQIRRFVEDKKVRDAITRLLEGDEDEPLIGHVNPQVFWMMKVIGTIGAVAQSNTGSRRTAITAKAIVQACANLVTDLQSPDEVSPPPVWSVTRNREASVSVWRSTMAVKADAARRLFEIDCSNLTWAIMDSGIDARHPAFRIRDKQGQPEVDPFKTRITATYDFTVIRRLLRSEKEAEAIDEAAAKPGLAKALKRLKNQPEKLKQLRTSLQSGREIDWDFLKPLIQVPHDENYPVPKHQHGTHVAGIIGADWRLTDPVPPPDDHAMSGVCPDIKLYDLRVLDDGGRGDEFSVMAAMQFVRHLNANKDMMMIQGVNLSLSIRHDVSNYACGSTPVCEEANRLIGAGIIVVTAAGNNGYLYFLTANGIPEEGYRSISITDPGNTESVITVGATHRDSAHLFGVSYFSSRGPTGDGRIKPDLVAPGEKIVSTTPNNNKLRMDGTSQAAPHVSGAAALLLARYPELIGRPTRIKEILCKTATDLGRERYFQGAGMVDVLRALQSV
ncbi:MAG TPA: S8 family peptidase [Pyrinomonadaceae bacterium]|nr:S8 family peptidase [Pyrinomonadaceae bacterium]